MNRESVVADIVDAGVRLDAFLADEIESLSRSFLQKLIKEECILVNGNPVKSNYRLAGGDVITLTIPEPEPMDAAAEPIPLDIVYEDEDILFVNKPKGMVVHPAPGHYTGTLVNGLLHHCQGALSGINGVQRPGIVHRIDRDTTGLLVVCKNDFAHQQVAKQLAEHSITRKYRAIVHGVIHENRGTINEPIGRNKQNRLKMGIDLMNGKQAITHYTVLQRYLKYSYVECQLETGRTHQIRVHMTHIHHPILGDPLYGNQKSPFHLGGQTLHAMVLGLHHPRTGQYLEFEAPLPDYFTNLLTKML